MRLCVGDVSEHLGDLSGPYTLRGEVRHLAGRSRKWPLSGPFLCRASNDCSIRMVSRSESQKVNLDALHVGLDDEDRQAIAALPKNQRFVNPGFASAWDEGGLVMLRRSLAAPEATKALRLATRQSRSELEKA